MIYHQLHIYGYLKLLHYDFILNKSYFIVSYHNFKMDSKSK